MNQQETERTPYFRTDFDAAEFRQRCLRVMDAIGDGAVAVIQGAPASGAFDIFRQHNDFYYLCGVEVPHACLLLDGRTKTSRLYLPPLDPKHERSEGASLNASDGPLVCRLTGVDAVRPPELLAEDLQGASEMFVPGIDGEGRQACRDTLRHARSMIDGDPWDALPAATVRFRDKLAAACGVAAFHDLTPILDDLRLIKSPAEIQIMRRAGKLAALAVTEAMRCTRPGMMEYQLAAIADYVFHAHGSQGGAYRPIVASGENIYSAHYYRNNCEIRDGDLVLMDYAPDLAYYTSDIGRFWPAGGRYAPWQRELYGFMVQYHQALLAAIRPGLTPEQIYAEARQRMRPIVEQTEWSQPSFEQAARDTLTFDKHLTHPVGMAVHDVGTYHDQPLRPGLVFALDPQLWVPDERLYIRVEDTVVVTESGVENLTQLAPLELDDVERVMTDPGSREMQPGTSSIRVIDEPQ